VFKVPDPKLEVPDLRSVGIRLNLTRALSFVTSLSSLCCGITYVVDFIVLYHLVYYMCVCFSASLVVESFVV